MSSPDGWDSKVPSGTRSDKDKDKWEFIFPDVSIDHPYCPPILDASFKDRLMSTRGSTGVCSIGGQVLGRSLLADD